MEIAQISQETGIKNYHLAFITYAGNCTPAWGGQSSYAVSQNWAAHLTDQLRKQTTSYSIAFGGANGSDLSYACSEAALLQHYQMIIDTYQPKGLDFDIENSNVDVEKMTRVLKSVQATYPNLNISFTLPVMPEGLVAAGKAVLSQAQTQGLRYQVNIMAMDFGPAYNGNMADYASQAATQVHAYLQQLYPEKNPTELWQLLGVTVMIGVNDVNVESFTLNHVDQLRSFAQTNQLGMLSMWSIARDQPCADTWASPICSGKNFQTKPYEFSQRFMQ